MRIITGELMKCAAEKLKDNEAFVKLIASFDGTITFRDNEGSAYISFFHGKLAEYGDGSCDFGSDFYLSASNENWVKAFGDDKRKGLIEHSDIITLEGNQFTAAGNAKAFYLIWDALRSSYLEQ